MKRLALIPVLLAGHAALAQPIAPWQGKSARTLAGARVSVTPDGPWLAVPAKAGVDLEIHDDAGARPRFAEYAQGLKLLLHVDPAGLQTFSVSGAMLYPTAAGAKQPLGDRSPGMKLDAGTRIDAETPAADGLTQVSLGWTWTGGSLQLRGFVPAAKLGKVYKVTPARRPAFVPNVTLPGSFQLLDAPGGTPFVISTNAQRLDAMTLERKGKFALVRIAQGAVGWIASAETRPIPKSAPGDEGEEGGVEGGIEGGVFGDVAAPTLAKNTPVYDAIDGRVIGQVVWAFALAPAKQDRGWSRFDVPTRFGVVEVWARATPAAAPPQNVPPTLLETLRKTGDKAIVPDDATKVDISVAGKDKVIASFKLCLDVTGVVSQVRLLKSSGFAKYDAKLEAGMRTWTYRPFEVNGAAVPVCTAVTFIYSQAPAAPRRK